MAKWKAGLIAGIITFLMGFAIYVMYNSAIHVYDVIEFIFAIYGFFQAAYWLFCWLMAPSKKTLKETVAPVMKFAKPDESWDNPFLTLREKLVKETEDERP